MQTIDIHCHLLSPTARFDRWYDRLALTFFAKKLGADPAALRRNPHGAYVDTLTRQVVGSRHVKQVCLFGVDARVDAQGRELHRDPTVCADNESVLAVARTHPGQVIPFLSVNPLRPDALDLLDRYQAAGCRGAKFLQNYWGTDLRDPRFIPYYERLRELGLPLVVHIGSEFSVPSDPACETVEMLDLPLEVGVRVIAAHMGLGRAHGWRVVQSLSQDPATFGPAYFGILERLERHPNLWADLSAILTPIRARALPHLAGCTHIHHKLLFGTDFPVPFTVQWSPHGLSRRRRREIEAIENPFDRYADALLEFFPPESPIYTNHRAVLGTQAHPAL